MKTLLRSSVIILMLISLSAINKTFAQCACDNVQFGTSPAPVITGTPVVLTTCIFGGEFRRVTGLVAGETYRFETCGDPDFDTQITIYAAGCASGSLGYNDDFCGLQSQVDFTPAITGDYDILVDQFFCSSNTTCMTLTATLLTGAPPPPPVNDACANATLITCPATVTGSTTFATTNAGEAGVCGNTNANDVWYKIVGNGDIMTANTCTGSSYDTWLSVYSAALYSYDFSTAQGWTSANAGTNCNGTNWGVNSWGVQAFGFTGSSMGVPTVGGEHSYLMSPVLNLPANFSISFKSFSNNEGGFPCFFDVEFVEYSTDGGTTWVALHGNDPNLHAFGDNQWRTISYTATNAATANGLIRFRYDTGDGCCGPGGANIGWYVDDVNIFSSSAGCGSLTCIGNNDDFCGLQSQVTWTSAPGIDYYIRVHGFSTSSGNFSLNVTCVGSGPANDLCAGAIAIPCGGSETSTTVGALPDANACGGPSSPGLWYSITPAANQNVTLSLCGGSTWDTRLSAYTGTCGALSMVACNDDFCGLQSQLTFAGTAGVTYYILVNGFSTGSGPFTLTATCTTPPPNDECTGVTPVTLSSGVPHTFNGNSVGASNVNDGPFSAYPTVWHAITLTNCSDLTLSYCGNSPVMGNVWLNLALDCPVTSFTPGGDFENTSCGDGNYTVSFLNLAAGTYWIPVLAESTIPGFIVTPGPYSLTVTATDCPPPPANDDICGALPLVYGVNGPYQNVQATVQPGEPVPAGGNCNSQIAWCEGTLQNTLWFTFVAPPSGSVSIQSEGFDTQLALYEVNDCNLGGGEGLVGTINGGQNQTFTVNCSSGNYTITVSGTGFLDETSWTLTDASNVVIASGGPYAFGSTNTVNVSSSNGPMTFNIETQGSFNDNVASYTIDCSSSAPPVLSGNISGGQNQTHPNLSCIDGYYEVTVSGNGFLDETTWTLTDASNNIVGSGGPYASGSTNTVTIFSNNGPLTFNIETQGTFNDNVASFTIECAGAPQFLLIAANDDGAGVPGFGSLISPVNCLTPGETYWVQMDGYFGDVGSANITLTEINPNLTLTGEADCEGNITLTPSGGSGTGYEYSTDGVTFQELTSGGIYTVTVSGSGFLDETTWTLTDATNTVVGSGGPYGSGSTNVVVLNLGSGPFSFNIETQGSFNDNVANYSIDCGATNILVGTITGGQTYSAPGLSCPVSGPTIVQPLSTTATYYLRDDRECIVVSVDVTTPDPLPAPVVSSSSTMPICFGESTTLSSQYLAADGYQFSWNGGFLTSESITVGIEGPYSLVVTDANGCETAEATFIVYVTQIFADPLISDVLCFGGNTGIIEIDVLGAVTNPGVLIYNGPFEYAINGGSLQSSSVFTGVTAGNHTVQVYNPADGCSQDFVVFVDEPDPLTGTTSVLNNVTCNGGSNGTATAQGSGGVGPYTYNWLTPIPKQIQTNDEIPAGTWTVVIEDANGCTATATVTITEPDPIIPNLGPDRVVPYGTANGYTASGCTNINPVVTGGSGNYVSYQWSTGATTATLTGVCNPLPGTDGVYTYTVTVTDDNGCTGSGSVTLIWSNIDCSNNSNGTKIQICMVPPGNPGNCQTVCISVAAAPALLANTPSYVGACNPGCAPARIMAPDPVTDEISVNLMPNPTTGRILVDFVSEKESASSIVVMDLQGRVVMNVALDGSASFTRELDMSNLENGLYILNIMNNEGLISTSRVAKTN